MGDENSREHGVQGMPGMDMAGMQHGGHTMGGMAGMDTSDLKRRFWVCLVLALPVVVLSPMMGARLPFQFTFPGSAWVVALNALTLRIGRET